MSDRPVSGQRLRSQWGFALFGAFSLLSLVRLLLQAMPGHYRIFAGAGSAIWRSANPYGTDYGTGVGLYFYSPTCALTVFGPLALLPEKPGLAVYMLGSWALFVWGARGLWRSLEGDGRQLQWFWALTTAQMVGGILASKLEIAMTGILMGAIARLASLKDAGPRSAAGLAMPALWLSAILNWKLQPLPVVGLLLVSWTLLHRDWKLPAFLGAFLGFWYALPWAIFPAELVGRIHVAWKETFSSFVSTSVLNFENVFAFLHNGFGIPLDFRATQLISAGVGALLVLLLIVWIRRAPRTERERGALMLSLALGCAFMTALSPLGQNNALILYAPLLLVSLRVLLRAERRHRWTPGLAGACAVMILAYSDLVPLGAREALRHLSIKPLACLFLASAVFLEMWSVPPIEGRRAR